MEPETAVKRQTKFEFGYELDPVDAINGSLTVTNTVASGAIIYCMKPMGADVTVASAKDTNGDAIPAMANMVIQQGDEYKRRLREVIFVAITSPASVTCYKRLLAD